MLEAAGPQERREPATALRKNGEGSEPLKRNHEAVLESPIGAIVYCHQEFLR